jgi:cytidylate kinase
MSSIDNIINRQFRIWESQIAERKEGEKPHIEPPPPQPVITISRERGSRGAYFGHKLAERLGYQCLHREIIDAICGSTGYRKQMIEYLDEHYRSRLELTVASIFTGQAVDHADYVRNLYYVVLSMCRLGGVVLIGRGGNFILGQSRGFHIRVVCPRDKRIQNLMTFEQMPRDSAAVAVDNSDSERREWIRKLFKADINDPHQYDLVVNSAYIDADEFVQGIIDAMKQKVARLQNPCA